MSALPAGFVTHNLDGEHVFHEGRLPEPLAVSDADFERLWELHPEEYHEITMHGRPVKTPRWQQAYGADYHYTGRVNVALPVPAELEPLWQWARESIDPRLNGLLLNWYDGQLGHYIGKHRDSTAHMIDGAPIVTVSLGEERVFRLRPYRGEGFHDSPAAHGTVFVMPYATNLAWTHEVPRSNRATGRRISITLRGFETGEPTDETTSDD